MITAIEIENFKGIGERQRVEFRPLTLLFGPNSAGKSTILHALHYAREVFERHNFDADQTAIGGPFVDLGGFRNFVHNRDQSKSVSLAFEISLGRGHPFAGDTAYTQWLPTGRIQGAMADRIESLSRARIELSIKWSVYCSKPVMTMYRVSLDGAMIATILDDIDKPGLRITELNVNHPIFGIDKEGDIPEGAAEILATWDGAEKWNPADTKMDSRMIRFSSDGEVLDWDTEIDFNDYDEYGPHYEEKERAREISMALLSSLLLGPAKALRSELRTMTYLGPLRQTPPRGFLPPRTPAPGRWATGLAAWDTLHDANDSFLAAVNSWLSQRDRLDSGYRLQRRRVAQLDLASPLAVSLQSLRAFDDVEDLAGQIRALPCHTVLGLVAPGSPEVLLDAEDVGEGIGQIIPVITAAISPRTGALLIEQPELHVHPRVQVGLGDLFIQSARPFGHHLSAVHAGFYDADKTVVVETHSEHLMLRILRRIRETADGTLATGLPKIGPEDIAVLYVQSGDQGSKITRLRVNEEGEFIDRWPHGFFDERGEELFG